MTMSPTSPRPSLQYTRVRLLSLISQKASIPASVEFSSCTVNGVGKDMTARPVARHGRQDLARREREPGLRAALQVLASPPHLTSLHLTSYFLISSPSVQRERRRRGGAGGGHRCHERHAAVELRRRRETVLAGVEIVFSRCFPNHGPVKSEEQDIWVMAEAFGAKCCKNLVSVCTSLPSPSPSAAADALPPSCIYRRVLVILFRSRFSA